MKVIVHITLLLPVFDENGNKNRLYLFVEVYRLILNGNDIELIDSYNIIIT